MAQVNKACIVIGLQRCTVADYGSKLLYLVTAGKFAVHALDRLAWIIRIINSRV